MTEKPTFRRSSLFPKQLGVHIEPLTRPVLKAQGLAGSRILTEWEHIVGHDLAAHCQPEKLSFPVGKKVGGTLTIAAENGFAPQLQHMQPVLLERLATYFGYKAITRITISHTYVPAQPPQKKAARVVLPAGSEHMADGVEDEELRAALQSFAQALSGK